MTCSSDLPQVGEVGAAKPANLGNADYFTDYNALRGLAAPAVNSSLLLGGQGLEVSCSFNTHPVVNISEANGGPMRPWKAWLVMCTLVLPDHGHKRVVAIAVNTHVDMAW